MSKTAKLKRLLGLIPLLYANQGIAMDDLVRLGGFRKRADMIESLRKLMMMGVPPFSPGDFIDVFWDADDRVYLEFPQGLDRPLALTPGEWSAVEKVLAREAAVVGAGEKSREHLAGLVGRFSSVPVAAERSDPFQNKRLLVEEALADRLQIEFQYRTLSAPSAEIRRVDPWLLFQHRGVSYLVGHCYLREAPRYFHLERMEDLEILDVEQTTRPPADLGELMKNSPIFSARPVGFTVRLAFRPELRAPLEQFFRAENIAPFDPRSEAALSALSGAAAGGGMFRGWLVGECKVQESIWFRATLRSLGHGTVILSPAHLRAAYRADLERIAVPAGFVPA